MDHNKLVELLKSTQIPDTNKVKAATAELRKDFYPHPEALIGLLHVIVSSPEPTIRMLAAVQALRLVHKHWEKIEAGQKPAVRNELLQAVVREQDSKCRHGESRVIAAIATLDFEQNEWTDLLPAIYQLATSDAVGQREVGSYVIFSLLEANPPYFEDHLARLFELFAKTIRDPESRDVRVNTMLSISAMLMLVDVDEDETSLNAVQEFIPAMVDVLKDAVESGDSDRIQQSFEVFQSFLAYESALINKYFKDLVFFMMELASNTQADEDVRNQALAFLAQCVRYRRMKIQGIPDLGGALMRKSLQILSEVDDDDDEDDATTPARTALALIDQLSSDLPPRQVIVPLLEEFPKYASSQNPGERKACILALGNSAEGAPEFMSTQISGLMPGVLQLLQDPERSVRYSALLGLMRLGEDLADSMTAHHDDIMTALVKNLEHANSDAADEKNAEIIRSVCGVIDSMAEGFGDEIMQKYGESMITQIGSFLGHPDVKVKAAAAGALGAIAASIKTAFIPFLKQTMEAMSAWVTLENGEDELALRSAVCNAMGRIAGGVGAKDFSPYVMPLLQASEKALQLDNSHLRETTFILWSQLARVYEGDLGDSLAGIFKGLFDSLELEEQDVELDLAEDQQGLVDEEVIIAGKKIKIKGNDDDDDEDGMDDSDDEDDWDDLVGVSAAAFEKEIALEVLGEVIYCAKEKSAPYIERAIELVTPFAEHSYEGCRKTAIGTLWRTYACVCEVLEAESGTKWQPGLPLQTPLNANIAKLGEIVSTATLQIWQDESDRDVVTEINRSVAFTLKACGPSILGQKDFMQQVITVLGTIITRSHPSQQDLGDEDEEQAAVQGSSEWDWLTVDTALDVVIGLAAALGSQFAEIWKVFEKPIMKFVSSQESLERSTAVGVVAECVNYMGGACSPYTATLLRPLLHRLSDEDKETKSNAAYATGQLVFHSQDEKTYLPEYNNILAKLEPLLQLKDARLQDNAAGCVCRMIMAHPDKVPIANVLPALVDLLPLKEDYEENKPVYQCIHKLYAMSEPTVQQLTPKLIPVFQQVLSPPEEQLEDDATRALVQELLTHLSK
ncbi:importin beta-4 [Microdochium trichocladiopsis]|uniref:Importin beta-4 n=1 Tax=Microdochium trichocladiopsis TaxID=1682393 RepID=A0A9P8Y3P3_9PEZI|nr:importin beta-4 [Microdochium trichocladiopsis]KAH7027929.1 importin beta-4 [Microdochium trichocladiopsis]